MLTRERSFVICNQGFTIERCIHGREATYNDIAEWNWKDIPAVMGGEDDKRVKSFQVKTKDELEALLTDKRFAMADGVQFVELHMPKNDAPRALLLTAEASARVNDKVG